MTFSFTLCGIVCLFYGLIGTVLGNAQCHICLEKLGVPQTGEAGLPGPQGPPGKAGPPGSPCGCSDPAFKDLRKDLEYLRNELADLKKHAKFKLLTWSNASNGLAYRFFEEHVTYLQAKKNCAAENARIASAGIRKLTTRKELLSSIADTVSYLWVGLDDLNRGRRWIWSDGIRDVRYRRHTLWRSGEPNNARGNEHCALMNIVRHVTGEVSLNDVPCGIGYANAPYICEREQ
ncbi:C-type lectin mannose-binding isoform-like [Styela clava]|uniref:C-type lectin mannose-binding isoform-like n=1 Tax=Styela clava TaxID=7725 RepID=UPI001939417C|nr:C-type lectin mannose-binding isoform-like [Styela clava]